jgi:hypothetical protein
MTARLTDYPDNGYFPISTPFSVTVSELTVTLTPNVATKYIYIIG